MALTINKFKINLLNTYSETIADGIGMRYSIYLAGCRHACPGCHNVTSWDPQAGIPFTDDMLNTIIAEINNNPMLDGITLSGGDPFFNPQFLQILLAILKERTNMNIWCYTGYTYEQLIANDDLKACLYNIDTLVDGRFVQELTDPALLFRGSSNQRIIHLNPQSTTINYIQED